MSGLQFSDYYPIPKTYNGAIGTGVEFKPNNYERWYVFRLSVKITTSATVGTRKIVVYLETSLGYKLHLADPITLAENTTDYIVIDKPFWITTVLPLKIVDVNGIDGAGDTVQIVMEVQPFMGGWI